MTGVQVFCDERSNELYAPYLSDLKKVGDATFTIKELANEIFRIQDNAARRKVQIWMNDGLVARIGELPNKPNRPAALYGIQDARVLVAIDPGDHPAAVLDRAVMQCPNCHSMCISDRVLIQCARCTNEFQREDTVSLPTLVDRRTQTVLSNEPKDEPQLRLPGT